MENNNPNTSGAGPVNQSQNQLPAAGAARLPPQQQPSLIRTDQVQKLPHLNDQQKASHTQLVRSFWEILNSRPTNSPEYQTAHNKLAQVSQNLMRGMRMFQQNRQQQQAQQAQQQTQQQAQQQTQQQQQQQQGQQGQQQPQQPQPQVQQPQPQAQQPQAQQGQQQAQQSQAQQQQRQPPKNPQQAQQQVPQQGQAAMPRPGQQPGVNPEQRSQAPPIPQSLQKLFPHVQQKVNSLNFVLPPAISKEQTEGWLPEAKLRYGMALQKQEMGKMKLNELRQQYAQRQSAGNLTQEEMQEFKNRQIAAENMAREGTDFLNKFKEQQESFKAQQQNQLNNRAGQNVPAQGQAGGGGQGDQIADVNRQQGVQNQMRGPAPHTINSAVAARHQADQAALSPSTTTQAGQMPSTQAPSQVSQAMSQPLAQTPQSATQPPTSQPPQHDTSSAETAMPQQQQNAQGTPRPLSQQAAMAQAAQSYSNTMNQQNPSSVSSAANSHAHPQGYLGNRGNEHSTRNINMPIPKNLSVPPPAQVSMGPARPTLSGGPSQGSSGIMGQPAIQKHPGYVLEGDGQRVLSKKMLDTLVKQVTGGGEGEGLTPDAEEFVLQMADDFVDDVITAACRLAKLRPSSTLDIRDIQLVLERNYNIRIPGFSSDDLRTVKKPQPTQGWTQKMSAVQAAKVTQGKAE